MFIENYFYTDSKLKISKTTTKSTTTLHSNQFSIIINKCLKRASDHFLTVIQIILLLVLGLTILLMDFINASANHLINVIPVDLLQSPRGIDDMLAADTVPGEITLGTISSWLCVV